MQKPLVVSLIVGGSCAAVALIYSWYQYRTFDKNQSRYKMRSLIDSPLTDEKHDVELIRSMSLVTTITEEWTFASIALDGNLEEMKRLRSERCAWDTKTLDCAVYNGNLENVRWLYENGCPRSYAAIRIAILLKHREMIDWLIKYDFPVNEHTYITAIHMNDVVTIEKLHKNSSCPIDKTLIDIVHVQTHSLPYTVAQYTVAQRRDSVPMVQYNEAIQYFERLASEDI